jgi:hypothetical protein
MRRRVTIRVFFGNLLQPCGDLVEGLRSLKNSASGSASPMAASIWIFRASRAAADVVGGWWHRLVVVVVQRICAFYVICDMPGTPVPYRLPDQ